MVNKRPNLSQRERSEEVIYQLVMEFYKQKELLSLIALITTDPKAAEALLEYAKKELYPPA